MRTRDEISASVRAPSKNRGAHGKRSTLTRAPPTPRARLCANRLNVLRTHAKLFDQVPSKSFRLLGFMLPRGMKNTFKS